MSCCDGFLQAQKPGERCEIIRPQGVADNGASKEINMYFFECMFGYAPLLFATYPALALRLPGFDEQRLKSSLAKALQALPTVAGRFRDDSKKMVLNGAGVPFKVVESSESAAPEVLEERSLLTFADFYRPGAVRHGSAPPMSIKLTTYKDGSAVLCMCRSHMLFDGTSAWIFLNYWARLARGEAATPPHWEKDEVHAVCPDLEKTQELAQEVIGKPVKWSILVPIATGVIKILTPIADTLFLHAGVGVERQRVFFSDQEVANLKTAATPATGSRDGWVSTQEALCAFLLQALAKLLLPSSSKGLGLLTMLLDPRKSVKLPADQLLGCGLVFATFEVPNLLTATLAEVATSIHEAMQYKEGSPDTQNKKWRLLLGAAERKMHFGVFQEENNMKGDIMLAINNSSKRELPDFGSGKCNAVLTNAGPTLLLPAKGGIEVFLDNSVFRSAKCYSTSSQAEAAKALRSHLPQV